MKNKNDILTKPVKLQGEGKIEPECEMIIDDYNHQELIENFNKEFCETDEYKQFSYELDFEILNDLKEKFNLDINVSEKEFIEYFKKNENDRLNRKVE